MTYGTIMGHHGWMLWSMLVKTTVTVYYLHGAMKKAREIVFFKTKFTHLSADSYSFLLQRRPDYTILQLLRGNAHPLR